MSSGTPTPPTGAATAWISPRSWPEQQLRNGRRFVWLALLAYALALWTVVPQGIGYSWRECDTQAIARNFLIDGFDPLHPRVDWRGAGLGYVECEFPLYQLMVATSLAAFGEVEWPGRLISMLAVMLGALALHRLLELRAGPAGAAAGVVAFLCTGSATYLGARVMPDALCMGLGLAALATFVRYLASGSAVALTLSSIALALSALQKPLALQLGLVMFGWTVVQNRARLREPRLWMSFAAVLAVVGAWLVHGKNLHAETGLTFGVISGGDTKFPDFAQLLQPKIYAQLAWTTLQYGFSLLAGMALVTLGARRRLDGSDLVLLASVVVGLFVSLRYSYHHNMGPHYHSFAAVAGAWCLARAWPAAASRWLWTGLLLAAAAHGGWRLLEERQWRSQAITNPPMELAVAMREVASARPLAIVRAEKPRFDPQWQRTNNFEDPRFLYQSRLRGWVLPADGFDLAKLTELHGQGGRIVYDPLPAKNSAELSQWLDEHGDVLIDRHGVRIHRLHDRL